MLLKQKEIFHRKINPFWIYLTTFQAAAALHFTILGPLGERILPIWLVGLLIGLQSLTQLLMDIPAGHILDRYGYLKMLRLTTITFFIAAMVLFFNLSLTTYLLTLLLGAFGWLFFGPGADAYILTTAPKNKAGHFVGMADTSRSLGTVISIILLSFALAIPVYSIAFILCLGFMLALIALVFLRDEAGSVHHEKKIASHHYRIRRHKITHFYRTLQRLNPASSTLLIMNVAAATFYAIIWFVVPLSIARGVQAGANEWGLAVFDLSTVLVGGLIGKLADDKDKRLMALVGLSVFAVTGTFLGFTVGALFLILGFLVATGEEIAGVSLWAWLNNLDKDHAEDGYVAGILTFFNDIGWAIGPIVGGLLYGLVGPAMTIMFGGLFLVVALLAYVGLAYAYPLRIQTLGLNLKERPPRKKHKH